MNLADSAFARLELFSGVLVSLPNGTSGAVGEIVERLETPGSGLRRYRVRILDADQQIDESELQPLPADRSDPLSMFRANIWQSGKAFRRRQSFLKMLETWHTQTAGIPSLLGVRIEPMGHQLYAMRRVLANSRPRFILADEVGLGKTIEAGLVLQALMQEEPQLRVLIIAPGSMSRQWFSEMYLRFGARAFGLLEAEDLIKRGDAAKEFARSRLAGGQVIISTTALMAAPTLCNWIAEGAWDLVVLDEAHRISAGHQLYPVMARVATHAAGFLALSATPSSKELAGLSSLLALVAPEAYQAGDNTVLEKRISGQKRIWQALNSTIRYLEAAKRESVELDEEDLEFLSSLWEGVGNEDPVIGDFTSSMRTGSRDSVEALVAYVQEFHRVDQRLIRTRRATLTADGKQWPERRLETLDYEPSNAETNLINHLTELSFPSDPESPSAGLRLLYERVCGISPAHALKFLEYRRRHLDTGAVKQASDAFERLLQDPEPGYELVLQSRVLATTEPLQGELRWLSTAINLVEEWGRREGNVPARFRAAAKWIQSHLTEKPDNKVLVFCQEADVVVGFANFLRTQLAAGAVETFHYEMPEEELSQIAHRFQRVATCRVLVSDELGGEGRNFQVASAVLHMDTPWSVSRIEQRIGRLDRIARPPDRDVLSVATVGPGDLEQTIFETHRDIFRVYHQSIGGLEFGLPAIQRRTLDAMRLGAQGLRDIQEELRAKIATELDRTDEAFDCALDSSKRQLSEGNVLARGLTEAQQLGGGSDVLLAWAEQLGFRVKRRTGDQVEVVVDPEWYRGPKERLPYSGRKLISGTFKHNVAMQNDALQFFGPGHPLIDFLVREFHVEGDGRCAISKVLVGSQHAGRLFAYVSLRCSPDLDAVGEKGLSPALRLRVLEQWPPRRESVAFELLPHENPPIRGIAEEEREFVAKLRASGSVERVTPSELNLVAPLATIWKATNAATTKAITIVRPAREVARKEAARRLADTLIFDRRYLEWRAAQGDPQAAKDVASIDRVVPAIEDEIITVDSVYVVLGVRPQ